VLDLPHDPKRALPQLDDLFVLVGHFPRRPASAPRRPAFSLRYSPARIAFIQH
jgi:hypothetical protein